MKNKKLEGIILIVVGFIIIGCGLYIYFVAHTIYPNSTSNRVQDLNWLLKTFGKLPLTILICMIGLIPIYTGLKKLLNR
jgi:uncharacterized membrane protein